MALFAGTFWNKVDRKGRISVPALFRQVLAAQSFAGIYALPSLRNPAIDAHGHEYMERLNNSNPYDFNSAEHDDLTLTLFGDAHQLPFDGDGRIILPADLLEYAAITERAAFVGRGNYFQIWQPEALQARRQGARERVRSERLTIPMVPPGGRP